MTVQNKKEDIIQASITIFVEEGYDRPTMDSIAKNAQVSKRTLYKHFSNKRALLEELILYLVSQNVKSTFVDFKSVPDFEGQVKNFIKQKLDHYLDPNGLKLSRIILAESFKEGGFIKDKIENILRTESSSLEWIDFAKSQSFIPSHLDSFEVLNYLNKQIRGMFFFPKLLENDFVYSDRDIELTAKTFIYWCNQQEA